MSKYDDFNLDLNKVESNAVAKSGATDAITFSVNYCGTIVNASKKLCSKTAKKGNGCHETYTKIGPCNRTYGIKQD
ncbi:hypothetical protein [Metaclostridioides mangenotii]|uniref:Uncharacterized protein n=1 Tax=Metaclostridioides mangenotii TaxID=1540 RepID=A0ABS4E7X7_9FIRM|nr:hypothetical protein [Clostridioides mangenotii]MBP1854045.1 hypothetical protein [Clostridioides mangenotii]